MLLLQWTGIFIVSNLCVPAEMMSDLSVMDSPAAKPEEIVAHYSSVSMPSELERKVRAVIQYAYHFLGDMKVSQVGLHSGRREGAVQSGRWEGALHSGRKEGALHSGRRKGTLHSGEREKVLHSNEDRLYTVGEERELYTVGEERELYTVGEERELYTVGEERGLYTVGLYILVLLCFE